MTTRKTLLRLGRRGRLVRVVEAVTYSGRSVAYLRARFGAWQSRGLAEWRGRVRYYRRCVLEHRGNADIAREAGRRAAA